MKIIDEKTNKELVFPIELYCSGASSNITNSFVSINGHYGSYHVRNSAHIGVYNFNITGTIEAKNADDVQKTRSKIISTLFNKNLFFFKSDADTLFHKCVLNGSVNVSFNQGYNISRAFTINFTLTCYDGVAWSKKEYTKSLKVGDNDIEYSGSIPITPLIIIKKDYEDFFIKKSDIDAFIQCLYPDGDRRSLYFNKDVGIINNFRMDRGLCYSNKSLIKEVRESSLLNPIILKNGHNYLTINNHFLPDDLDLNIQLIYRECFY